MNPIFNRYSQLPGHFYSRIQLEPLHDARLLHQHSGLLAELGLSLSAESLLHLTSGQTLPEGCEPLAQKYTGHQFGYYNPDLGDGRGALIGQCYDAHRQLRDLHLKGCGQTPYSRRGDGRAVLRSAIREYLGGEALFQLSIPSTRALALCHNNEPVRREQLEPRASYVRVAQTHVRFGHFEWLAQQQDREGFIALADYVIDTLYPELLELNANERYGALLSAICERTAELIAGWQSVGFCHGVLNTDNMSVAGETFDFGPYAFMDDCQLHYVCNHSDSEGRYAYSQQPSIGLWNCQVLAQAFSLLLPEQALHTAIDLYVTTYNASYLTRMRAKIGLLMAHPGDRDLVADLLRLMDQSRVDFQHLFLQLAECDAPAACLQHLNARLGIPASDSDAWQAWLNRYFTRRTLESSAGSGPALMRRNTPRFVLRNYINQEIIAAVERGDTRLLNACFQALQSPYELLDELPAHYYEPPQHAWQKSMALSCSS
jgi:hypothetical protein